MKPDPWQIAYVLAPVFGWVRQDDEGEWGRVVRYLYVDVPRKNGKTTMSGGTAVYLTCADGERGAQVYAVASGKDQARFCFDPVKALAEKSPDLAPYVRALQFRIIHKPTSSFFAVASAVADLLHGANIHGAIIDELHVHKNPDLVEAVESGTGSRRQPLVTTITTADDGSPGTIYDRRRRRVEQLAQGVISDPASYGVVWAAEAGDDPYEERTWRKANPGLGISPTREFMASAAERARQSPADLASFLRLHLGVRTKLDKRFLDLAAWDQSAAPVEEEKLLGRPCYGGLDLAATSDLTALAWDFPDFQGGHDAIWRIWAPEGALKRLNERTAGEARVWVERGLLKLTPGSVTDYGYIRQEVNRDRARFAVQQIGFDPWNSSQLVTDLLADGAPLIEVRQGYASMSPPTKELQRLLLESQDGYPRYRHGGNPLVRWTVDNFAIAMDPSGNVKPDRASARDKIDPVVAAIIALSRALTGTLGEEDSEVMVYDDPVMIGPSL